MNAELRSLKELIETVPEFIKNETGWYCQRIKAIENPNPAISKRISERLGLPEIPPPIHFVDDYSIFSATYGRLTNAIVYNPFDTDDEITAHETAHSYFWHNNLAYMARVWNAVYEAIERKPASAILLRAFQAATAALNGAKPEEHDLALRTYVAIGRILDACLAPCESLLEEGFAEWVAPKIGPYKHNDNYADAFHTYEKLETKFGEARTLEIALSATTDRQLMAALA